MGKKSAHRTSQPLVAVVPMGDVLEVLRVIADNDAVKADIAQSGADSFTSWLADVFVGKQPEQTSTFDPDPGPGYVSTIKPDQNHVHLAFPEDELTDAQPALDLNAIRDQAQRTQPQRVTAYVVQGAAEDVAEVLRNI